MKHLILIILFTFFIISCKRTKENVKLSVKYEVVQKSNDSTSNNDETNYFEDFLQKFISQKNFRNNRINFPLKGYNSDNDPRDNYSWTKEEWEFYSIDDFNYYENKNIISQIIKKDSVSIWRLYKENSGYDINYHFELKQKKWYLVYYSYTNW